MKAHLFLSLVAGMALATPAAADQSEIGYPKDALGFNALVDADYSTAESQLRDKKHVTSSDPARLINLGLVLARTGRSDQAALMFRRALEADEVELILANGEEVSSRQAARRAMRALNESLLRR